MKKHSYLKSVLAMCLALTMVAGMSSMVHAQNLSQTPSEGKVYTYSMLNNVGKVVDGGTITVNGVQNSLYRVFENQAEAIEDIKVKVPNLLNTLATEYDLAPLANSNWQEYRDAMYMLFDSDNKPADYTESNLEFRTLRAFFDIYENDDKNAEIMQVCSSLSTAKGNATQELGLLLPYTEPIAQEFIAQASAQQARAPIFVEEAIKYATEYAESPNTPTYYYFNNGDCANFVSQILEHAGVSQVVYDSEYSGWWHKRTSGFLGIGYKHTHSRSWTMADTFSRYMGIYYTTTSNVSFAANIEPGSIIAADFDKDGDWDHMGFVTDTDDYVGSYGYYDYRVAQHTSNYHGWASLETNGWDHVGSDGGKYARIRN